MNIKKMIIFCSALLLSANIAWAQDGDAESTIRLMHDPGAELPEAVMKEITLPEPEDISADDSAADHATKGLATAKDATARRDAGLLQAMDALQHNADMAAEAQNNRENSRRPEERPAPPENPGPPGN